jgi:predicted hydrocarbon binding protein
MQQRFTSSYHRGSFSLGRSHFASMLRVCLECSESYSSWDSGRNGNAARELGQQLGSDLATHLSPPKSSATLYSIIEALSKYLKRNQIAGIEWRKRRKEKAGGMLVAKWMYGDHPLAMRASASSTRIDRALVRRTLCGFKEGLLQAIFESKLAQNVSVREVECLGTGAPSCVFEICPLANIGKGA